MKATVQRKKRTQVKRAQVVLRNGGVAVRRRYPLGQEPHAQLAHQTQGPAQTSRTVNTWPVSKCEQSLSRLNTSLLLCSLWKRRWMVRRLGSQVRGATGLRKWKRLVKPTPSRSSPKSRKRRAPQRRSHRTVNCEAQLDRTARSMGDQPCGSRQRRSRSRAIWASSLKKRSTNHRNVSSAILSPSSSFWFELSHVQRLVLACALDLSAYGEVLLSEFLPRPLAILQTSVAEISNLVSRSQF